MKITAYKLKYIELFIGGSMKNIVWLMLFSLLFTGCDFFEKQKLEKQKVLLELSERCNKAGRDYMRQFQIGINDKDALWDDPEFHYSVKMNKCYAHIRYIEIIPGDAGFSFQYNQLVDVFENRPIMYGWFKREKGKEELLDSPDASVPNYTSNEYFKRKDKLFSE